MRGPLTINELECKLSAVAAAIEELVKSNTERDPRVICISRVKAVEEKIEELRKLVHYRQPDEFPKTPGWKYKR